MKTKTQVLIAALLLTTQIQKGECQKADLAVPLGMEPRKFVTVYEEHTGSKMEGLWWLYKTIDNYEPEGFKSASRTDKKSNTQYWPYQKYSVISEKAKLRILFDHELLAKSYNFKGSLSLEAHSKNGPVPVNPYSMVGKGQNIYGVNSAPTVEIANYLLKLKIDAFKCKELIKKIRKERDNKLRVYKALQEGMYKIWENSEANSRSYYSRGYTTPRLQNDAKKAIDDILTELETIALNEEYSDTTSFTDEMASLLMISKIGILQALVIDDVFDKVFNYQGTALTIGEIRRNLTSFKGEIDGLETVLRKEDGDKIPTIRFQKSFKHCFELKSAIARINQYIAHMARQKPEVQSAFLHLLGMNITEFNVLKNELNSSSLDSWASFDVNNWSKGYNTHRDSSITEHVKRSQLFSTIQIRLSPLFANVSEFSKIVHEREFSSEDFLKISFDRSGEDLLNTLKKGSSSLLLNSEEYDDIVKALAYKAGVEIYQRLITATIDIEASELENGDELTIDVVWYPSGSFKKSTADSTEKHVLSSVKFYIRKVGWHTNIAETSLLIKRIDEEFLPADYPLSRSNFKPTAGAALMWSYHNTYRGWKDTRRILDNTPRGWRKKNKSWLGLGPELKNEHTFHTGSWTGNTLRWLEPSFGLNVTYLDFDNDQTFELGFGPMIGLWRNKMFVTAGYNLMVQGQSPYYVGIGFSFSKIAETIGKNVEQNPSRD